MRAFLLIVFCLNLFTGGMLFGEIAKLPALAEHFQLHKKENPATTLIDFLRLHYSDSRHQADPLHNHHSLPFHQHAGHSGAQVFCSLPAPVPQRFVAVAPADASSAANFYYCRFLPAGFTGSLFQPPRA